MSNALCGNVSLAHGYSGKHKEEIMNSTQDTFKKYVDETGEEYFCPIDVIQDDRIVSEWELGNCVEISTAGRYAGNLKIADRSEPDWRF